MKNLFKALSAFVLGLLFVLIALIFTGCDLASNIANDNSTNDSHNTAAGATDADGNPIEGADNSFVWKPVSESDGNLVVLLPASLAGQVEGLTISGSFGSVAGSGGELSNGNRPTYRFPQPGSAYGQNITVQAPLKSGGVRTWTVPDGGSRVEAAAWVLLLLLPALLLTGCYNSPLHFEPTLSANMSLYSRGSNQSPSASRDASATDTELLTDGGGQVDAAVKP